MATLLPTLKTTAETLSRRTSKRPQMGSLT